MPRIEPVQVADTRGKQHELFERVQRQMGMVPNLLKTLGHSSAALSAYLNFSQSLHTALTPVLREQIALAVAGINECDYCASAHSALGARVGIEGQELTANLLGESQNTDTRAALQFARTIVEKRGLISDNDLQDARAAGFTNKEIIELVTVVALSLFTNYVNHIARTDIDFPVVHATSAGSRQTAEDSITNDTVARLIDR
ncbi:MAG: carboxymuconolactone decarboxylase family protein [Phycisphaerae bacterium]